MIEARLADDARRVGGRGIQMSESPETLSPIPRYNPTIDVLIQPGWTVSFGWVSVDHFPGDKAHAVRRGCALAASHGVRCFLADPRLRELNPETRLVG